jgi:hypothetical protein
VRGFWDHYEFRAVSSGCRYPSAVPERDLRIGATVNQEQVGARSSGSNHWLGSVRIEHGDRTRSVHHVLKPPVRNPLQ